MLIKSLVRLAIWRSVLAGLIPRQRGGTPNRPRAAQEYVPGDSWCRARVTTGKAGGR